MCVPDDLVTDTFLAVKQSTWCVGDRYLSSCQADACSICVCLMHKVTTYFVAWCLGDRYLSSCQADVWSTCVCPISCGDNLKLMIEIESASRPSMPAQMLNRSDVSISKISLEVILGCVITYVYFNTVIPHFLNNKFLLKNTTMPWQIKMEKVIDKIRFNSIK